MIEPKGLRVLLRKDEVQATRGGIVLPQGAGKSNTGVILAIGKGAVIDGVFQEVDFEVDDHVVIQAYCGTEITVNGEKLLIMDSREILAVVPSEVVVG